ncbi:MAG TPA: tRNA preQ1(34) S-adenosylmethionine ribosyltransferase-isomerase QueA [Planctomycetota bacterium]|jgi:S-adenosylmethionine:tRNA ribosyltransferase-isomerase|nr:tRNA preQ1(34) S-adenosylmethionine ribosyltransferase-isomerase QueA [Planctomycetota bacterium]MDP7244971.1 tRNA preQ1(34) S-adenosylmethionine ribosyltransferase-isomerase QueA [Planctomycetota bacterium]HJM40049.1 tRNA preQ1(34) S-adenosylmethionine ribosyltransferase-isomerase QueA [Planctomycetota bacterium]|tara:strand:- start:37066 stop:38127 length:1062 start_codon:yes stop_codon:yes gene_type:complete
MSRTDEYDFDLPEQLIARHPLPRRQDSKLLAVQCSKQSFSHREFSDFASLLGSGDLLVLNDTRVVPARILAKKPTGGKVEGLWLSTAENGQAHFLISGSRLRSGTELLLQPKDFRIRLVEKTAPGRWLVEKESDLDWFSFLRQVGLTPLPPYIRNRRRQEGEEDESAEDQARYQSVWAEKAGAVAAPTASLHFGQGLIDDLKASGVHVATLTLHVGEGTFLPVETEEIEEHPIHEEWYEIPSDTVKALEETRAQGGRIISVGTTVCRALESYGRSGKAVGLSQLFILPGFSFQWVDALLTNFHTPQSTLLALVSAFAEHRGAKPGLEFVKAAYKEAIQESYRFYSYGDASFWE